ncbi:hypothetical protein GYMLUDRAFT_242628 [Collybiopsis luxurians FD-317 M1]|uniref:XRRM domain-containing protein n=1 Tax=Collybiopsis luxurians FD-317 M1 TaxID=944289 RepID=A0A0D0CIF3_9AGAR|nr:hypothetical protein GYMLUDRAFT_242628 [Collybiopsis luxurians FD-317 M1]
MSFAFIPRKVGKNAQSKPAVKNSFNRPPPPSVSTISASKEPPTRSNEDLGWAEEIAILVVLSLTNYQLWANGDIRRRLEEGNGGFLPLRYVLKHSSLIHEYEHHSSQLSMPSESVIVKELRRHAEDAVEVRMVLSPPKWSNWGASSGSSSSRADEGMYEIRPKNAVSFEQQSEAYTRDYWEKRTVYIENLPPAYRTIPGIYRFIRNICRCSTSNAATTSNVDPLNVQVQRISYPPHYFDANDASASRTKSSRSKGKAFAFIVLSSPEEVAHLSSVWSWDLRQERPLTDGARTYGFRALPKANWEALKDEYLAWRKTLLDEIFTAQENGDVSAMDEAPPDNHDISEGEGESGEWDWPEENMPTLTSSSPYPPNCLIFVRNVHSGTNKTTLRTLFRKMLINVRRNGGPSAGVSDTESIDYVDYTKGMDTCYLRLASPVDARLLVSYLCDPSHPRQVVQREALDDNGVETEGETGNCLRAELVQGRREEFYWEKVPIKVRQETVRKALSSTNVSLSTSGASSSNSAPGPSHTTADPDATMLSPSSLYPPDCLLFVRNIHLGTNKTTLRALFTNILSSQKSDGDASTGMKGSTGSIDYVDYTKGTDTCHLRLSSPLDARCLEEYFEQNEVVQSGPLDDGAGISSGEVSSAIVAELVRGTKERIYWEKVPLKVRQEAVRRAVASAASTGAGEIAKKRKQAVADDIGVSGVGAVVEVETRKDAHGGDESGGTRRAGDGDIRVGPKRRRKK